MAVLHRAVLVPAFQLLQNAGQGTAPDTPERLRRSLGERGGTC